MNERLPSSHSAGDESEDESGITNRGTFTPPVAGAIFREGLVASFNIGALPPVDFRAVCLVIAMVFDRE